MSNLVSTDWLAARRGTVRVVDASWYMPGDKRNPCAEFEAAHIPGAMFFDIDTISDKTTDLPHMLPPPEQFAAAVGALGIGNGDTVVVYDGAGMFSAARVWWMFKTFGHDDVKVLDGGLPKWQRESRAIESGIAPPVTRTFNVANRPELVRDFRAMMDVVAGGTTQVADARSLSRFQATEAEPRAGVRGGHMPGAVNVHYRSLLNDDGTFKSPDQLRTVFVKASIDPTRPVITTCGTGVTAAIVMLGLQEIGAQDVALYDGSWTEWGAHPEAPVVTGT